MQRGLPLINTLL